MRLKLIEEYKRRHGGKVLVDYNEGVVTGPSVGYRYDTLSEPPDGLVVHVGFHGDKSYVALGSPDEMEKFATGILAIVAEARRGR